jgi:hypothetical protein
MFVYGVLHQSTNLTSERVLITIVDTVTGEDLLTLDDRSFSFSTQKLLGSTSARGAPLYFVKFALQNGGGVSGCEKTESNCFVLGEKREGRVLEIVERTYLKVGADDESVRRSMIPARIMMTYQDRGQPSSLSAKDETELVSGVEEIDGDDDGMLDVNEDGMKDVAGSTDL